MPLSDRDRAILDFEREHHAGTLTADEWLSEIREKFDLDRTTYYLEVAGIIHDADALDYDPITVRRLRRVAASAHPTEAVHAPVTAQLIREVRAQEDATVIEFRPRD